MDGICYTIHAHMLHDTTLLCSFFLSSFETASERSTRRPSKPFTPDEGGFGVFIVQYLYIIYSNDVS
jgi:hypothetical protein